MFIPQKDKLLAQISKIRYLHTKYIFFKNYLYIKCSKNALQYTASKNDQNPKGPPSRIKVPGVFVRRLPQVLIFAAKLPQKCKSAALNSKSAADLQQKKLA